MSSFSPIRHRKNLMSGRWLLASLSFHASLALVVMQLAPAHSGGRGPIGLANEGGFSVTWIPGKGGGADHDFDTAIPDGNSTDTSDESHSVTVTSGQTKAAASQASSISTVETDPTKVFADEEPQENLFDATSSVEAEAGPKPMEVASSDKARSRRDVNVASASVQTDATEEADSNDGLPAASKAVDSRHGGNSEPGSQSGRSSGGRDGRISFFGLFARAKRVVFVIDASESMRKHSAMEIARSELSKSLKQLDPTSYFQIVFFDLMTHAIGRTGEKAGLLRATSANLRLAELFIKGIQPEAGTDRFAAVKQALSFDPDVIYLLTDADEPEISAKELFEIRRGNKHKASIHVVEFGIGADLGGRSFLKRLASQNQGDHFYRDLTKSVSR